MIAYNDSENLSIYTGLLIFCGKKPKFRKIFGANSRKNRLISRDFRRRKVKIRRKIGRFHGILAEKSQISKDFQRKILRKIGRFHGNFGEKLRQETISKKQPILLDFFGQISLKSINFASISPALFNIILLTGIIIYSFNNSSLKE